MAQRRRKKAKREEVSDFLKDYFPTPEYSRTKEHVENCKKLGIQPTIYGEEVKKSDR